MSSKLVVTYRSVSDLIPYVNNSRTHSDEQVAQIAASMKEFGWTNPILVDEEGVIIAGHGRLLAAQRLKMDSVPTISIEGLSKAQRKALVIADNKMAMNAGWDMSLLALELGELDLEGFDLGLTGFSVDELDKLLMPDQIEGNTDPDAVPELPAFPIAEKGDVWLLGRHRLVCGDSTMADDVAKALNGVSPHLMVTDPPYGVKHNQDPRKNRVLSKGDGSQRATGTVANDDRADWTEAWALFPGDVAYVWHGMKTASVVESSLVECGFELRSQIVWAKTRHTLSPGNINPKTMGYNSQHECCFYLVRKGASNGWSGDRSQTTLWNIDHAKSETGHGAQKPIEAMKRPIENNSSAGQAIYEPFAGSSTTLIACEMTGRTCHAIELDPAYVDVGITRWQDFTGKEAVHEETGLTFSEMEAQRQPAASAALSRARKQKGETS
jgi:DNA modification methylase